MHPSVAAAIRSDEQQDYTRPAATEVSVARVSPSHPADRVAQRRRSVVASLRGCLSGLIAYSPVTRRGRAARTACRVLTCTTSCACALPIPCRHRATHRRRRSPWSKQQRRQLSLCNLAAPLGPASHGADPQAGSESKETTTAASSAFSALRALPSSSFCPAVCCGSHCRRHQFGLWISQISFPVSKEIKVVHD